MDKNKFTLNSVDGPLCSPLCLYHQPGFTNIQSDEGSKDAKLKITVAATLCIIFMLVEFVGGYLAGSLAIMTDAAHLMSDCISFIIGILAIWISSRPADGKMSFGYKRIEVLGAILSILVIWILTMLLVYLAINRIIKNDFSIDADTMMIVAGIGIVINIIMGFILHGSFGFHSHGHSHGHSHSSHNVCNSKHGANKSNNHNSHLPVQHQDEDNQIPTFVVVNNASNNAIRPRQGSIVSKEMQKTKTSSYTSLNHNHNNSHNHSDANAHRLFMAETILPPVHDGSNHAHLHADESANTSSSSNANLNVRAAFIHVVGDFIQSIGVFTAALVIKFYPNGKIADPLCTLLFSFIVILTTVKIIKESVFVILDAVPKSISLVKLEADLRSIEGVRSVHHLNVWSQTVDHNLMMGHIIIDEFTDSTAVLNSALSLTKTKYNIKHSTFQIERYHSHDN
ncbi:zinc transporter 2 isoform X4 [Hermetia illucens]|uniref:zinc transporter 2 isoform X4 n=1 Tax=Hermetia illucens TaxID=343691 RepID=UPI0018CC2401|nr:zinc transporter 2 isoform X4 [Hermetia illucens]